MLGVIPLVLEVLVSEVFLLLAVSLHLRTRRILGLKTRKVSLLLPGTEVSQRLGHITSRLIPSQRLFRTELTRFFRLTLGFLVGLLVG